MQQLWDWATGSIQLYRSLAPEWTALEADKLWHEKCHMTYHLHWLIPSSRYGTSRKVSITSPDGDSDWLSDSINLYVSYDLSTWKRKAKVFTVGSLPQAKLQQLRGKGPYRIERPKVLYNAAHRYYVLLFHLDNIDNSLAEVAWATSVSPYGPFVFQQASRPDGLGSLDLNVAVSADGTDAYLVRSVLGGVIAISNLAADYLGTIGICTNISERAAGRAVALPLPGQQTQAAAMATSAATKEQHEALGAPALFYYRDKWYLLGSRYHHWSPGPPVLYVSSGPDLCGATWTQLQQPAKGPGADSTFDSTPAFVFTYSQPETAQVVLIYYGDRWNLHGHGSVGNASYVWLPLVPMVAPSPGIPVQLHMLDPGGQWKLGDYLTHVT
eukprot:GHRR01029702.1.p1 GENE.GHRR01029702.1~~GHRR01029702.1.p1  ORF type:complete len:383 (+),score=92.55 GHRR01029702.1:978-2126(+)